MRLYRIDGDSQMRMSSNSPLAAPAGVGSWLMKTRSLSRFFDSSAPVPPVEPFLPTEKITATALLVRGIAVPHVAPDVPTPLRTVEVVQIRRSGAGVFAQPSVKRVRMAPWVVKSGTIGEGPT